MEIAVVWDVMPCSLIAVRYQCFGGVCCFNFQGLI